MSFYLHEVPGRLRIKTPGLKRNPAKARTLQHRLNAFVGVQSATVNAVTGSLLVLYDPELVRSEAILGYVSRELDVHISSAGSNADATNSDLDKVGRKVSKALLMLALDTALDGSPLAMLTAFI